MGLTALPVAKIMNEIWKDIEGYEGLYQISNYGRVKSLRFNHTDNNPRILKNVIVKGYCCVNLYKDKKMKMLKVHRLVAQAFIPNPNNLPVINHIDEDKTNNFVGNLEWCSVEYNSRYGTARQRGADKLRKWTKEEKKQVKRVQYKLWRQKPEVNERLREYCKKYRQDHKEELSAKQKEKWLSLTKEEKEERNRKARERYAKNKLGTNASAGH